MKKKTLTLMTAAVVLLLGIFQGLISASAEAEHHTSDEYTFDRLMEMSADEFAELTDMSGYLTWIEEVKQKYEVRQGIAEYDLLMQTAEIAAEMQSLSKAAQVLGIPESMIEIEEPDGVYYDADNVNVTDRTIVLHLDLSIYGHEPDSVARAYYLSEKRLKNCEEVAEYTPWYYGGNQTSESSMENLVLKGDVDCNGQTAIADAVLLARYLAEDPVEVSAQGLLNAELDGNPESLDAGDFAALLQIIAGVGAN